MSKIILPLLIMISTSSSLAVVRTKIVLEAVTNLKIKTVHTVLIDKNLLTIDGLVIDLVQLPNLVPSLQILSHVMPESLHGCEAGIYVHKVTQQNKTKSVRGCLGSKRADELVRSIIVLKKARVK